MKEGRERKKITVRAVENERGREEKKRREKGNVVFYFLLWFFLLIEGF